MTIGERTAQAIKDRAKQNGASIRSECRKINVSQQSFNNWEKRGINPEAYFLQEMVFAGYDVIYILTGEKK